MNAEELEIVTDNLNNIETACWVQLTNAILNYKDPFHNPVVANVNRNGVNLRTVVLRKTDTMLKQLFFYTDVRSGKWDELKTDNSISWIFYNPLSKIQVRLAGKASLHHDDRVADEAWANSGMSSRKIYSGEIAPSTFSDFPTSGLPTQFEVADPTPEQSEAGRKNFGIVVTKINWMEWVWLNSKGHRRAAFHYSPAGEFKANWLVP